MSRITRSLEDELPCPRSWIPLSSVRLAIVGCSVARQRYGHALQATAGLQVTSLADSDNRSVRAWARELGGSISLFPDFSSALDSDPPPNAVLIASPLPVRAEAILAAASRGMAILCDPPFASTIEETDALLQTVAETGVLLLPSLPRRFDPIFQLPGDVNADNSPGTLYQVRCEWRFPTHRTFAAEIGADIETGNWGALLEYVATQTTNLSRAWLGNAISVSGDILEPGSLSVTSTAKVRPGRVSELANIIVTHERGHSSHHFSNAHSVLSAEKYLLTGDLGRLEIIASPGSAASTAASRPSLAIYRNGSRHEVGSSDEEATESADESRSRAMLAHFSECARGLCDPLVFGEDARAAQEIVHAAYLSSQEGHKVTLPLRRSPVRG